LHAPGSKVGMASDDKKQQVRLKRSNWNTPASICVQENVAAL